MPYFFTFRRTKQLDNETSLINNKIVAQSLINNFNEIVDLHPIHSPHHFSNRAINKDAEFPELHFYLDAEIESYTFIFCFWKDTMTIELSVGNNTTLLFKILESYAIIMMGYGFKIEDPNDKSLLDLKTGLVRNMKEYNNWGGLVIQVENLLNKDNL